VKGDSVLFDKQGNAHLKMGGGWPPVMKDTGKFDSGSVGFFGGGIFPVSLRPLNGKPHGVGWGVFWWGFQRFSTGNSGGVAWVGTRKRMASNHRIQNLLEGELRRFGYFLMGLGKGKCSGKDRK